MIIAITGTPGVGKTSVSYVLKKDNFEVVNLFKTAVDNNFLLGDDPKRGSKIIDIGRLNDYVKEKHSNRDLVFIDGHLSHLLKCVDKVIVFRCHPEKLKNRLSTKGWKEQKLQENIQAEILDIVLCETVDIHPAENVFEIDTTDKSEEDVMSSIIEIVNNDFRPMKKYNIGNIDWSDELFKNF